MKTKEFSNEDIAKALGWVQIVDENSINSGYWRDKAMIVKCVNLRPHDFKNDMNAATKHVRPALMEFYHNTLAGWSCNGPGCQCPP